MWRRRIRLAGDVAEGAPGGRDLRSVITSTKLLARLNEVNAGWTTSPFLFGFNLANLWQLDVQPAQALIRQEQAPGAGCG